MKGMRAQVAQAQTRLAAYQKQKGITFADERTRRRGARLAELSTQLLCRRATPPTTRSRATSRRRSCWQRRQPPTRCPR